MGCFNFIGCVSKMPIYSTEKIALFFFTYNPKETIKRQMDILGSFTLSMHVICPPVIGDYNEYGGIEKIVRDRNVENIEKTFGDSIEEIMKVLHRPDLNASKYEGYKERLHIEELEIFYCIEHLAVYERIATTGRWFYDYNESWRISRKYRGMFEGFVGWVKDEEKLTEEQLKLLTDEFGDIEKVPNYEQLFKSSDFQQPRDVVLTTNMNPEHDAGIYDYPSEIYPKGFMRMYRLPETKDLLWEDEMMEPYAKVCAFYHGLFDLQMEMYPSRYGRQSTNDKHVKKLLDVYSSIIDAHLEQQAKWREEGDYEYKGWSRDLEDFDE